MSPRVKGSGQPPGIGGKQASFRQGDSNRGSGAYCRLVNGTCRRVDSAGMSFDTTGASDSFMAPDFDIRQLACRASNSFS